MRIFLLAPEEYWKLSKEEKQKYCNGCGGRGGKLNFLIPQRYFRECCNIHDYMYAVGSNENDKKRADATFLYNMNQVVREMSGIKKWWYKRLAKMFYKAVFKYGDYYFWRDKIDTSLNMNLVDVKG